MQISIKNANGLQALVKRCGLAVLFILLSICLSVAQADATGDGTNVSTSDTQVGGGPDDCPPVDTTPCSALGESDVTTTEDSFQPSIHIGNPVNLITGNKYQLEVDYQSTTSKLQFNRHYNSHNSDKNTGLGQGWTSTFSARLSKLESGGYSILQGSGKRTYFTNISTDDSGLEIARADSFQMGYVHTDGQRYFWVLADGRTLTFFGSFLIQIDFPGNRFIKLKYKQRLLSEVTDEAGRLLSLEYYKSDSGLAEFSNTRFSTQPNHLSKLTLPDGKSLAYDYDDRSNLTRVRYSDGTSREFHYEDDINPNHLTGITDRTSNRFATWSYHEDGRVATSEHGDGIERITIDYYPPAGDDGVGSTTITNSLGVLSHYSWQSIPDTGKMLLLSSDGPGCATCPMPGMRYAYGNHRQDYRLSSSTDTVGNGRHYSYDEQGRITRIDRSSAFSPEPVLEVRYEYEDNDIKPTRIFKPSVNSEGEYQRAITYGADNLPVQITELGYAPTIPADAGRLASAYKPVSRTTRISYAAGRISEVDGPRSDVDDITRFQYDTLGRLVRMELPSGEVIAINKYDEHGRAVEFRRAEDPTVVMQYDIHGNVSRITRLGQSVEYEYNAENKLVRVTNPNGKTSILQYDEAQRLSRVSDDLGRTVELSLNSESQLQDRAFLGLDGSLIHSLSYVYDAENRIQSVTEAKFNPSGADNLSKTVELDYDEFGQVNGSRDTETGAEFSFVFSDLGRLLETIEPSGLSKKKEYDVHNRLIAQTDRRLNATQYQRDDFGLVHFLISPDSGVTQYDFDAAGNRIEKRNANGQVTRYRWDAGNRLVEQNDADGKTTYTYHAASGRLVETTNPYNTEQYTYTTLAQLSTHTRVIDGNSFTTQYVYAVDGKLSNKILPDGQSLRYHYYESGPTKGNLRAITREALFGLSQYTVLAEIDLDWRDGQTSYLSHNGRRNEYQHLANGQVSSVSITDTLKLDYAFDDAGNIVGIRQNGYDQRYEYIAGQLSGANTRTGNYNYQYDVSGNRTVASATGSTDDYESVLNYRPATYGNRLETQLDKNTGEQVVYRYNDAGSPIRIGELRYEYNAHQRPVKVTRNGDVVAEYSYNSFGERIKKVAYSQNQKKVTYFLYDNRTLVAEIDGDTMEYRQNVYLKNTPVAHFVGKTAYAVHTDNLGTPKLITNKNGQTVWEAAHTPLGQAVIEKQAIQFNLRFPGQYADAETGTHYNYLRDYDPRTGRYLTSDPVGLEGGDNTYAYANNNVLGAVDVLGLSSQLAGLPSGFTTSNAAEPFTLNAASNAVANPSSLPDDPANIGITDPNQLVTDYFIVGSLCDSEIGRQKFNDGIEDFIDSRQDHHLLVGSGIEDAIQELRYFYPDTGEALAATLDNINVFDDSSFLLIPPCSSDTEIASIVRGELGTLVQDAEINAIIAGMEPAGADGCRAAQIVDVTDLHAEVLQRFQVRLATDPRVVEAERELILAQAAFEDFVRLHGNPCLTEQQPFARNTPGCQQWLDLYGATSEAAKRLSSALEEVYEEQVANGLMPRHNVQAAAAETRKKLILGVVGIIIPLTLQDAALDATLFGLSKIGRLFRGAADLFGGLVGAGRRGINAFVEAGSEAYARASKIKKLRFVAHRELMNFSYADIIRLENSVGAANLSKLNADIANSPKLAIGLREDPSRAKQWKHWDDLGETQMRQRFEEIRTAGQYNRPPVTEYLSPSYIANHKAQFSNGAVRFVSKRDFDNPQRQPGSRPDGKEYVMTKEQADRAWEESGGNPVKLARALGLPDDHFAGSGIVRIDFDNPADLNVDVPSGNESSTWDPEWLPGGILPDGRLEAVITPTPGSWRSEVLVPD